MNKIIYILFFLTVIISCNNKYEKKMDSLQQEIINDLSDANKKLKEISPKKELDSLNELLREFDEAINNLKSNKIDSTIDTNVFNNFNIDPKAFEKNN